MARLVYLSSALRDISMIAADIEDFSQSHDVAEEFIAKLKGYCERFAMLPGLLGRARRELRPGYRSVTFGDYVIFFRYVDGVTPREIMEIINVIHGARDMRAFFSRSR